MVHRNALFLLLLVLCNLRQILSQTKRPDDEFLECYSKDKTKLENCLVQFWDKLLAKTKTGDPSLNITKEPIILSEIIWKETSPSLNLHSVLSNFSIWGFSNSKMTSFEVDKKARTVAFNVSTPYINVTTDFAASGTVILLQVKGKGKVNINATNVATYGKGDVVPHGSGVKLHNLKCNVDMKNIAFKIIETDTIDPIWEALGQIISENIDLLFEDIQPFINSKFSREIEEMTKQAYAKVPLRIFTG